LLRRLRLERQCVDATHERAERAVDELMLLEQRASDEGRRPHATLEVIAGAGRIRDGHEGARKRLLDAEADVLGAHGAHHAPSAAIPRPALTQAPRGGGGSATG